MTLLKPILHHKIVRAPYLSATACAMSHRQIIMNLVFGRQAKPDEQIRAYTNTSAQNCTIDNGVSDDWQTGFMAIN